MNGIPEVPQNAEIAHPVDLANNDRQQLWWLESFLAINGTNETHRERGRRLYHYLCATCEHEWTDVSGWCGTPPGTHQCGLCNRVLSPDEWRELRSGDL